jgi:hypothetical protein
VRCEHRRYVATEGMADYGGGYTCGEMRYLTLRHLVSVRAKIADLRRLEKTLTTISAKCEGGDTRGVAS